MKPMAAMAALCLALCSGANARAADLCGQPATIAPQPNAGAGRVQDFRAIFQSCRSGAGQARIAIRSFTVERAKLLLTVDPQTLATAIEPASCWTCVDTTDAAQADTRYGRALRGDPDPAIARGGVSLNAGLPHGQGAGVFITGDLCPSRKPLDRGFFETLERLGPHTPVALSISGAWLARHGADFEWLQAEARRGALDIAWTNHTYRHPYTPGLAETQNYMMRPGFDLDREIFDTERLLIARGGTPSAFFRFPGLVADRKLMEQVRARHLAPLGADAWLALSPPPRDGSIVLVHPNGNERAGLRLFTRLVESGKLPKPYRRIEEAP